MLTLVLRISAGGFAIIGLLDLAAGSVFNGTVPPLVVVVLLFALAGVANAAAGWRKEAVRWKEIALRQGEVLRLMEDLMEESALLRLATARLRL